jgi:hypothetical protein
MTGIMKPHCMQNSIKHQKPSYYIHTNLHTRVHMRGPTHKHVRACTHTYKHLYIRPGIVYITSLGKLRQAIAFKFNGKTGIMKSYMLNPMKCITPTLT